MCTFVFMTNEVQKRCVRNLFLFFLVYMYILQNV